MGRPHLLDAIGQPRKVGNRENTWRSVVLFLFVCALITACAYGPSVRPKAIPVPTTLLIFKLSIKSSYGQNVELPADAKDFDTVQWWLGVNEAWRIKTHAVDDDIHPHLIAERVEAAFARENTREHYGDVLKEEYTVVLDNPADMAEVESKMRAIGGAATLEMSPNKRFGFWNPDGRRYSSKSTPSS